MDDACRRALELAAGLSSTPKNLSRVAAATNDVAASWAFTQWELRSRAKAKFERASEMLFSREALEQATSEGLAAYHASKFPDGVTVADLTAGIGADLIALARRGPVIGYELDPERAEYALHNLRVYGLEGVVQVEDSMAAETPRYAFADPARRISGSRTLDPEEFTPNPTAIAAKLKSCVLAAIKLSPLLRDEYLESFSGDLEFVSYMGECREAIVWLGNVLSPSRHAVHVESRSLLASGGEPHGIEEPMEFFHEADPAAIRGHCLGTLCEQFQLEALGDSNGYLTGQTDICSPWLRSFRVLKKLKADLKQVNAALRDLGASVEAVKSRANGVDVRKLQGAAKPAGGRRVVLAVYPVGKSQRFLLLERLR